MFRIEFKEVSLNLRTWISTVERRFQLCILRNKNTDPFPLPLICLYKFCIYIYILYLTAYTRASVQLRSNVILKKEKMLKIKINYANNFYKLSVISFPWIYVSLKYLNYKRISKSLHPNRLSVKIRYLIRESILQELNNTTNSKVALFHFIFPIVFPKEKPKELLPCFQRYI